MSTIVYYAQLNDFDVVRPVPDPDRERQLANDVDTVKKQRRLAWYALSAAADKFAEQHRCAKPELHLDGTKWMSTTAFVSIAHCEGVVCAAVSDLPVGIDCEPSCRKVNPKIVDRTALPQEMKSVDASTNNALLRFWTAKEAAFKASNDRDVHTVSQADTTKFCITYAEFCDTLLAVATQQPDEIAFFRLDKLH